MKRKTGNKQKPLISKTFLYLYLFIFTIGVINFLVNGCSTTKYVPLNTTSSVIVKENVVPVDTMINVELPREREAVSIMYLLQDTSFVSTSLAYSIAYIDTANMVIKHSITNKDIPLPTKIQYKNHIVVKDSITVKEIPVPVPVVKEVPPKWLNSLIIYAVILTFIVLFSIVIKIKT